MTLEEGNKLIANFLGWYKPDGRVKDSLGRLDIPERYFMCDFDGNMYVYIDDHDRNNLAFHSSWDWLMPVVEKIGAKGYRWELGMGTSTNSPTHYCKIWSIGSIEGVSPLDAIYGAVIEFIKWYNTK